MQKLRLTRRSALLSGAAAGASILTTGFAANRSSKNTILIAGATGVVGHTALEHFTAQPNWDVIAVSRSQPLFEGAYHHVALDLTDEDGCRQVIGQMSDITHVVYAALHDRRGPVSDVAQRDELDTNTQMLRNLVEPLRDRARNLKNVTILQGTKAYGVHIEPFDAPAKERWPRKNHDNFYFLQEDYLKEVQQRQSWAWTIFRPQIIFGFSIGKSMNLIPVIGALAAIRREEGRLMGYPGKSNSVLEATDARLLARAFEWAGTADEARNEIFNVTNGDIFIWPHVWPAIANALNVDVGPDNPLIIADYFRQKGHIWDEIVKKHSLIPISLSEFVGQSDVYADVGLTYAAGANKPGLLSTIKIRQSGFQAALDTEDAFRYWFDLYAQRGFLPKV